MKKKVLPSLFSATPYVASICFLAAYVLYVTQFGTQLSSDKADWGQFGDFLGGLLNPLFSFFAFLVLMEGIKIQRTELAATKVELERSASAMEKQLRQTFDNQNRNELLALIRSVSDELNSLLSSPLKDSPNKNSLGELLELGYRPHGEAIFPSPYKGYLLCSKSPSEIHFRHAQDVKSSALSLARFVYQFHNEFGETLKLREHYAAKHRHLFMLFTDAEWDTTEIQNVFTWD
jgi:hypothetical protein